LGISRQAYYKRNRTDATRLVLDQKVADFVQQKRQRRPRLGTRKLHHLLRCQPQLELQVGRDRLFSILHRRRLLVVRKRAYHKTTDSHHRFLRHSNLLKPGPEQVVPTCPEQVWVADIT
jgi:putative transposase